MKKTLFFLLMTVSTLLTYAQPKIVAHRGHWRTEGSAQNSIKSLQEAVRVGCWGTEFDVWITADGVPVVFHDATVNGIRLEDTTYEVLMKLRLANGEFIPTLQQYLTEGKKYPECKMIFEIKSHRTPEREDRIATLGVELVHMLGMEKQVEYIAFSRHMCEKLHSLDPNAKIAYLNGDLPPKVVKEEMGISGIDYNYKVFEKHPEWLAEAKECGLEVNVWTVDGEEALTHHANLKGIDIITTNDPEILKNVLEKK